MNRPLDIAICRQVAERLQPRFDAFIEVNIGIPAHGPITDGAEHVKERLISYVGELYQVHREFGTENAIGAHLLNAEPAHGNEGITAMLISFCFSEDGLGIGELVSEFGKQGLKVSHDDLLVFGNETNQILNSKRIHELSEHICIEELARNNS